MVRPSYCVCLRWISLSVFLNGFEAFTTNISSQNVTDSQKGDVTGWESPFLQLRASLPSFSQPIRPYTLLTNTEDYHYLPKPRQRRPSRLLRLLGSSFDPFWMSIEQPSEASWGPGAPQPLYGATPSIKLLTNKDSSTSPPELREAMAKHRKKLQKEAASLDFGSLPADFASLVRSWLVSSAICELYYQWMDMGPAFWPRWLRQTDCETSDEVQSCSFPSGMKCVRAQTMHINILAWHCQDGGDTSRKIVNEWYNSSTEVETGEAIKKCLWRQVPYPVVTACKCSCK